MKTQNYRDERKSYSWNLILKVFFGLAFSLSNFSLGALACGPQEQDWTWGGVNQYQPEECTCEELELALNEEEAVYLGNLSKGTYLFSSSTDCESSLLQSIQRGQVKDRKGHQCDIGFQCTTWDWTGKVKIQ